MTSKAPSQECGILPKDIPLVFDRFFRADESRSEPGAGLGLSLVRAIVQAYRGDIKVSSSKGVGSTFTVVLPREESS
jgi:signal transduction histidine kinase